MTLAVILFNAIGESTPPNDQPASGWQIIVMVAVLLWIGYKSRRGNA